MTFTRHSLLQLSATHVIKAYSGFLLCYVTRTLHYSLLFYSLRSLSSWVRSGFWFIFFPPFLLSIVCWVFLQFLPFFPSYFLVFFLLLFLTFHFFFLLFLSLLLPFLFFNPLLYFSFSSSSSPTNTTFLLLFTTHFGFFRMAFLTPKPVCGLLNLCLLNSLRGFLFSPGIDFLHG